MNDLERFRACMKYEPMDRAPFWPWGGWPETIERWKNEGYNPDTLDLSVLADTRLAYGGWFFPNPPFEKRIMGEDEKHLLYYNHEGILMLEMKDNPYSSMPQFIKFPVETPDEFRVFWRERMQPDLTQRMGQDWQEKLREIRAQPYPFIIISDRWGGFFGPLRNMVGVERLCELFYDDPVFLEEMMDANAGFIIAMMDQILDVAVPDAFGFWEDMAYKTAPLVSPAMARKFMLPRYQRVTEFLRGRGVQYVGIDSDGFIDSLIPVWLDAGLNFIYPFETQAGMDVLEVRKKYGQELRIWGGFDKRTLAQGPAAIDVEIQRLRPLMEEGGFIPHTDHSCPPYISFANYCYYMTRMAAATRGVGPAS